MTVRPVFCVLFLWMVWVLQLGSSCASDTSVSYSEGHGYHQPPPPPERVYVEQPPQRVYVEPPPPERVYVEPPPERVYVAPPPPPERVYVEHPPVVYDDLPPRIPRGSYKVDDKDGKIRWIADDSGTFYLYDVSKEFVRYSGTVRRGQEVIVMPGDDLIYVDGRIVTHENLRRDARHQLYFAPGRFNSEPVNENRGHGDKTGGGADPGRTIPKGSARVASGKGDLAINAVRSHGTVYVYDEDDRNVVYTQDLDKGNSFQIFVSKGTINTNSKKVANVKFRSGHTFTLYFADK